MAKRTLTRAEQRELLANLEAIGADVKRVRVDHPDSPLAGVAFELASLTGKLQAAVAAAPVEDPPGDVFLDEQGRAILPSVAGSTPADVPTIRIQERDRDLERAREEVDEQERDAAAEARGESNG